MEPRPETHDWLASVRAFLEVAMGEGGAVAENERALALALDRLALATHAAKRGAPRTDTLAPRGDTSALRMRMAAHFPDLGLYRAGSLETGGAELVGDALDDLVDLVGDLSDVLWLAEHVGEADARWQFHFELRTHWGRHLRALQWYLHERREAQPLRR